MRDVARRSTDAGRQGTPTLKMDGKKITNPSTVAQWETALKDAGVTK